MVTGPVLAAGPRDARSRACGRAPPTHAREARRRSSAPRRSPTSTRCSTRATRSPIAVDARRATRARDHGRARRQGAAAREAARRRPRAGAQRSSTPSTTAGVARAASCSRTGSIPRSTSSPPSAARHRAARRARLLHLRRVPAAARSRTAGDSSAAPCSTSVRTSSTCSKSAWARSSPCTPTGDPLGWVSVICTHASGVTSQASLCCTAGDARAGPRSRCSAVAGIVRPTTAASVDSATRRPTGSARRSPRSRAAPRTRPNVGHAVCTSSSSSTRDRAPARVGTASRPSTSTTCSRCSRTVRRASTTSPTLDGLAHALQCGATAAGRVPRRRRARRRRSRARHRRHRDPARSPRPRRGAAPSSSQPLLGARVAQLVGAHVVAKRYLVDDRPGVPRARSAPRASRRCRAGRRARRAPRSHALAADPDLDAILALRRADERAKDPARAACPASTSWRPLLVRRSVAPVDRSCRAVRRRRRRRRPQRARRRRAARASAARASPCSNGVRASAARPITEQPWGPDFKVTALSYVVSLMPPTIVRELELERHGYKVYPAARLLRAVPRRPRAAAARRRPDPPPRADRAVLERRRRRVRPLGRVARRPRRRARSAARRRSRPALGSRRPRDLARPGSARVAAARPRRARRRRRHAPVHDEHRRPARRVVRVAADARRARR